MSEGWSEYGDPAKTSGLPEGYYHIQCAPKIKHSAIVESAIRLVSGTPETIEELQKRAKAELGDQHNIRCYNCQSEDDLKEAMGEGEYVLFCKNCYPLYVEDNPDRKSEDE